MLAAGLSAKGITTPLPTPAPTPPASADRAEEERLFEASESGRDVVMAEELSNSLFQSVRGAMCYTPNDSPQAQVREACGFMK